MAPTPPKNAPFRPPPMLIGVGVLIVVMGFLLPRIAPETSEPTPLRSVESSAPSNEGPGLGAAMGRLAVCLGVVCAAVVGVTWLVHKPVANTPGGMEVLAAHAVDARCVVYLIRSGDRRLLVGTDPAGVKSLVELPGPFSPPPSPVPTKPTEAQITTLFARIRTTS